MNRKKLQLDYNNLVRQILELLNNSDDETVREGAYYVGIGLELLTSYLRDVATLAIEQNNQELLDICKALWIVAEKGEEYEEIR